MKKYNKPVITDEIIELEDIIASSGVTTEGFFGNGTIAGDKTVDFFGNGVSNKE